MKKVDMSSRYTILDGKKNQKSYLFFAALPLYNNFFIFLLCGFSTLKGSLQISQSEEADQVLTIKKFMPFLLYLYNILIVRENMNA